MNNRPPFWYAFLTTLGELFIVTAVLLTLIFGIPALVEALR